MGNPRCNWVRDRLPLLAGAELIGPERRKVERHLIGCGECRRHRLALEKALEVLHSAAAGAPARPDAPSLWPALARQIRESRRPVPTPAFAFAPPWFRPALWPVLGLGAGLLAAVGVMLVADRPTVVRAPADPVAQATATAPPPLAVAPPAPAHPPGVTPPGRDLPRSSAEAPVAEAPPLPSRLDYDLERGTPISTDVRTPTY